MVVLLVSVVPLPDGAGPARTLALAPARMARTEILMRFMFRAPSVDSECRALFNRGFGFLGRSTWTARIRRGRTMTRVILDSTPQMGDPPKKNTQSTSKFT